MPKLRMLRTWVKVRGKDKVFQLTQKMAEREPPRIGVDLDIISEKEALKIMDRAATAKRQNSIDRRHGKVTNAVQKAQSRQIEVEREAKMREEYDAAVDAQDAAKDEAESVTDEPETPEEAEARLNELDGEDGAIKEDDLEENGRKALFAIIEAEELPVKKAGTNDALIIAIRESRKIVAQAMADADKQAGTE